MTPKARRKAVAAAAVAGSLLAGAAAYQTETSRRSLSDPVTRT